MKDYRIRVVFYHEMREFWDLGGNLAVTDILFKDVFWIRAHCGLSVLVFTACVCEWWHTASTIYLRVNTQTRRRVSLPPSVRYVAVVLTLLWFCPALTLYAAAVWLKGRGLVNTGVESGAWPSPLIQSFSVRSVITALNCPALTGHLLSPVCPLTPQWPLTLNREGSMKNGDGRRVSVVHTIS